MKTIVKRGNITHFPNGWIRLDKVIWEGAEIGTVQHKREKGKMSIITFGTLSNFTIAKEGDFPEWLVQKYLSHERL